MCVWLLERQQVGCLPVSACPRPRPTVCLAVTVDLLTSAPFYLQSDLPAILFAPGGACLPLLGAVFVSVMYCRWPLLHMERKPNTSDRVNGGNQQPHTCFLIQRGLRIKHSFWLQPLTWALLPAVRTIPWDPFPYVTVAAAVLFPFPMTVSPHRPCLRVDNSPWQVYIPKPQQASRPIRR